MLMLEQYLDHNLPYLNVINFAQCFTNKHEQQNDAIKLVKLCCFKTNNLAVDTTR